MPKPAAEADLPADTTIWVLASGKIGHEVNCFGIVRALGIEPVVKNIRPRALFERLAPYGPVDPRDAATRPGSLLAPPFPDIAIASGRATVPYLVHLKRASKGRVFTAFMQDPRWRRDAIDLIWVPEHDALRAPNVLATLTSPHHLRPAALRDARLVPDPRILAVKGPRLAMVLGGTSGVHRFETADCQALAAIARQGVQSGFGVMVTPSRRTPPEVTPAIREALADLPEERAFVWDGSGDNPYVQMLAHADAILVTGDSVNMIGEAAATGAPVHVYEPSGGSPKMTGFIDRMVEAGAVRRWAGAFARWTYQPVDATALIARTLAERFARAGGKA